MLSFVLKNRADFCEFDFLIGVSLVKNRRYVRGSAFWVASAAIVACLLLISAVLAAKTPAHAQPLKQSAIEPAPKIEPAIDGVLDLFRQKPVVALGDDHGVQPTSPSGRLNQWAGSVRTPVFGVRARPWSSRAPRLWHVR